MAKVPFEHVMVKASFDHVNVVIIDNYSLFCAHSLFEGGLKLALEFLSNSMGGMILISRARSLSASYLI